MSEDKKKTAVERLKEKIAEKKRAEADARALMMAQRYGDHDHDGHEDSRAEYETRMMSDDETWDRLDSTGKGLDLPPIFR
jgi:hypothetical protein